MSKRKTGNSDNDNPNQVFDTSFIAICICSYLDISNHNIIILYEGPK
jgi:hypothetical protein